MKIWLINPYGPIPIPEENWREYRFTIIGNYLSSLGHDVVWYTSSFSHHFKKQRSNGWKDIRINDNFKIRLVPTPGYSKNISLGRILRDLVFSYKVYSQRRKEVSKPDLIIYSESPLSFGYAGQKLAKYYKVPVIYDQMDLWPELIINSFPKRAQSFVKLLFYPVFKNRITTYNQLNGFISLAEPYLSIPKHLVPSLSNKPNAVIYNGIDVVEFRKNTSVNQIFLKSLPIKLENEIWFVFAGTLGPSYDILNLLDVAKEFVENKNNLIKIILAGDGPLKKEVKEFVKDNNGEVVFYLGQLKPEELCDLYRLCDVGLSTYTKISNVEMPDKFYDYTAAGLPIVNSLTGEVSKVISEKKLGLNYKAGDKVDLYQSLNSLVGNQLLREEMAANSFTAGMLYDKNNQIQKLGTLLESIIG
jgi:glycosyltransferase involved in cell wall biosynthesis